LFIARKLGKLRIFAHENEGFWLYFQREGLD